MRSTFNAGIIVAWDVCSDGSGRGSTFAGVNGGTAAATSTTGSTGTTGASMTAGSTAGAGGSGVIVVHTNTDASVDGSVGRAGRDAEIITTLPPRFSASEIGGFMLGAALGDGSDAGAGAD